MHHPSPGRYLRRVNGYGDCWYCNETVVAPYLFEIVDPDTREPMRVSVCRKRLCRESAEEGSFHRLD